MKVGQGAVCGLKNTFSKWISPAKGRPRTWLQCLRRTLFTWQVFRFLFYIHCLPFVLNKV